MEKIILTRKQFEMIKAIFDETLIDEVSLVQTHESGIGSTLHVQYKPLPVSIDITDVSTW